MTYVEAPGLVLTPRAHQRIVDELIVRFGSVMNSVEHYNAPPVVPRATSERVGYPTSFPHLLGAVHASPQGGDVHPTDLVLTSAACHHLYPLMAGRDVTEPVVLSVLATCFRNEPSAEPGRLRSFRMYEFVHFGGAQDTERWRHTALDAADTLLRDLGLATSVKPANDPFFGRPGKILASSQRAKELKWEITARVADDLEQAVASVNYHEARFGEAFDFHTGDGPTAHSACLGFGLERLVLALEWARGAGL